MSEDVAEFELPGAIVPMLTPLTEDGEVDRGAIEQMVEYLVGAGVKGLFVLGGAGEGPWLPGKQQWAVVETAVHAAAGRVPVIAGTLEPSTQRVLERVRLVETAGADAIAVTAPYYFRTDAEAQAYHFETVARATSLPIMLYHIPTTTHVRLAADTMRRVLELERVVLVKDSSDEWPLFQDLLAVRESRPEVAVLQGIEEQGLRSLLAGADGVLTGLSNVAPELFVQLVANHHSGDLTAAEAVQVRIDALNRLCDQGYWIECLKYAVSLRGVGSGALCSRPSTLNAEAKAVIRQLVETYVN